MFDNIRADLRAYGGNWTKQGFWVMVVYRFGRWRYGIRPSLFRKAFSLAYKVMFRAIQVLTGIELPCEAPVGRNLLMDHFGGIVISGYARIGDDCRIGNGVVIGIRNAGELGAPTIGNNVDISAGAVILGDIRIGNHVMIGANTVVLTDVPAWSTAIGVPAIITSRRTPTE
ncbi:serine acetyltransferase [Rhizobium sp. Root708]|uniref:serine O-acetyltransferase n=1 Tax=Rhizobium sp. Root708 TaxID=1736592 RepID=UPI0007002E3C|nr:DapH/DapD/GlmU-related protein [Rhizobium sp. Root708]KRB49325.1 serine acetyltransferase [Rhizobium sp. Root708]